MDLGTLIGLVCGLAIIGAAIVLGGDAGIFINIPGVLIVFGGTLAATFIKFTLKDMIAAFKVGMKTAFKHALTDPLEIYELALETARTARTGNLLALENAEISNELFRHGIRLAIDGHNPEFVTSTMRREAHVTRTSAEKGERMFRGMGESAPAFGMIGTLVGLVQMLANLSDPGSIGPAMAVAMLTTFYGALMANLVFLPIADKLVAKIEADEMVQDLVIESVTQIVKRENPQIMADRLAAFLPTKPVEAESGSAAQGEGAAEAAAAD